MTITRDRIRSIGGRCFDVGVGVFLIAVLVLIWSSSRTNADSAKGTDSGKATRLKSRGSRSNVEALMAVQGTIDVCLQDDSNASIVFLGNSTTGAYTFCCLGTTFIGTAQVSRRGNVVAFVHNTPDRRVQAISDGSVFKGNASVQSPPGTIRCTIADRDTRNNTCLCGQAMKK